MVRWTKKEIMLLICVVALVIVIPVLIHISYSIEIEYDFFRSKWDCGDILQYCGAIITALVAIAGVYISLKENRKNNLENKVLEYRPYIKSTIINLYSMTELEQIKANDNTVWVWSEDNIKTYSLNNIYGKQQIIDLNYSTNIQENFIILVYDIENIGLGHALNFKLTINEIGVLNKEIICKGEKKRLYVLISKKIVGKKTMYTNFCLEYKDVIDVNLYSQLEDVVINYDTTKKEVIYNVTSVAGLSEPLVIEKKIFE